MDDDFVLTDENFAEYCFQHYENTCVNFAEYHEDLRRIKYIKKLFTRYEVTGELKERLILNHIIILNNVFGHEHAVRILFFKIEPKHWRYLKPFLILLSVLPREVRGLKKIIYTDDLPLDPGIVGVLRKL